MKLRNLMVLIIVVFGISILAVAEESKIKWEYIKGGQGMATIKDSSFDEVWDKTQDVLLFEKFKPRGAIGKSTHEVAVVEKNSGLITVNGYRGGRFTYIFKVKIQEKDGQIVVKTRCNTSWKKIVTKKYFQLLKESLSGN